MTENRKIDLASVEKHQEWLAGLTADQAVLIALGYDSSRFDTVQALGDYCDALKQKLKSRRTRTDEKAGIAEELTTLKRYRPLANALRLDLLIDVLKTSRFGTNTDLIIAESHMYEISTPDLEEQFGLAASRVPRIYERLAIYDTTLTYSSLHAWFHNRGIVVEEWSSFNTFSRSRTTTPAGSTWQSVTIHLQANDRIAYKIANGRFTSRSMADIGLINRRTRGLNKPGGILLGLATGKAFPPNRPAAGVLGPAKKAISELRHALRELTQISDGDPFYPVDRDRGYAPRFTLKNQRREAEDRAKRHAVHESFDETRDYDDEHDSAAEFLRQADRR